MALVNISEAARLTGKNRRTIQRHITAGKLSKAADGENIDTSELLRVYGALNAQPVAPAQDVTMSHETALKTTEPDTEKEALKAEINRLKSVLAEKDERINDKQAHIDSLNSALLLLKHDKDTELAEKEKNASKRQSSGFLGWFKRGNKK